MEHLDTDVVAIWSNMRHQEKDLRHKRKFLMGLSNAPGIVDQNMRSHAVIKSILPESFLRKDDVFYEDVKQLVEKGFGACSTDIGQNIIPDDMKFCDLHKMSKTILTLVDDFSINGLYHLAKIVTRGSTTLCKTRSHLRKAIKKGLSDICSSQCPSYQAEIQSEISQLLENENLFRRNHVKYLHLTLKSQYDAVMKVLNRLEDMSSQTLSAMHRKLRGIHGYLPQLHPPKSGWNRDRLVDRVRILCLDMIHQLGEADKLQEPLAKAMEVAGLSSRLSSGRQDRSVANFVYVTPELEALQNELVKAIRLFGQRIKKEEIKILQHLLDPQSKVDSKGLKTAIKNMLIEFLFECSDMEAVPDSLLDALSLINKTPCNPRKNFSKEVLEEEVECILNVGAHIKQILWNDVPDDKLEEAFADVYMEDLEESADGDIFDDDDDDNDDKAPHLHTDALCEDQYMFNDFSEEVQSTGDLGRAGSYSPQADSENTNESSSSSSGNTGFVDDIECTSTEICGGEMVASISSEGGLSPLGSPMSGEIGDIVGQQNAEDTAAVDSVDPAANFDSNVSCSTQDPIPEHQSTTPNQYVVLQEVSDQASVVAYQLIGHMLKEFGRMEALGLDWDDESYLRRDYSRPEQCRDPVGNSMDKDVGGAIIVQAVHQVLPSFSNSKLETVKRFMSTQWQS